MDRRSFVKLCAASSAAFLIPAIPARAYGSPRAQTILDDELTAYIEEVNASGDGWTTWGLNDAGEVVELAHFDTYELPPQTRAGGLAVRIAVYVGKKIVGYLLVKVIDGIVKEVTGNSLTGWGQIAARKLLNRPVPAGNRVMLPCSIYPPNSGEYVRCMS